MSSTTSVIVNGVLPLVGVLMGAGATIIVQQNSAREARRRSRAKAHQVQRAEIKSAIANYLDVTQHVQTQLYAREHGRDVGDIPMMVERLWLAHAQVDILCSEWLRAPLLRHAKALNEVARHEELYPDWWGFVYPYKEALMNAIRNELAWPDAALPAAASLEGPPASPAAAVRPASEPDVM